MLLVNTDNMNSTLRPARLRYQIDNNKASSSKPGTDHALVPHVGVTEAVLGDNERSIGSLRELYRMWAFQPPS